MTDRKTLLKLFEEITDKAVEIMRGKNTDYATQTDSLANFRASEVLNVDPRKALLIRMVDKIKRQVNYIEKGTLSVDSAEDDIIDLINYSVLLHALNIENEEKIRYINDITCSDVREWTEPDIIEEEPEKCCGTPDTCDINSCSNNDNEYLTREELSEGYPESKYKEGDKVEVIDNTARHEFDIGEIITLVEFRKVYSPMPDFWEAVNTEGDSWDVYEKDIKPIQKETSRSFGI